MKNIVFLLIILFVTVINVFSQDMSKLEDTATDNYLEDLINYKITSVSKKVEVLTQVPSNIYVITKEDIENSPALTFQELLRNKVPGFWMATNDYNENDIYIRDFDFKSVYVLIDGIPIKNYMPNRLIESNFEIPLIAIERIEIIRGSAGSIYGANASSGLINIITKYGNKKKEVLGEVKAGLPGHYELNIFTNHPLNKQSDLSIYLKGKNFDGFKQNVFSQNNDSTTIKEKSNSTESNIKTGSICLNYKYEKKKMSLKSNLLLFESAEIEDYFKFDPYSISPPIFKSKKFNNKRFISSVYGNYNLSQHQNISFKLSGNGEDVFYNMLGWYMSKNFNIDGDIQYNFLYKENFLCIGANVRGFNYFIYETIEKSGLSFNKNKQIDFLDGYFIQNKRSFFKESLKVYTGLRIERNTFSNNKYSLFPMLKFVAEPNSYITFWMGYTKSNTSPATYSSIFDYTQLDEKNERNYRLTGSANIKPTSVKSIEATIRLKINYALYIESSLYNMFISDGVIKSPEPITETKLFDDVLIPIETFYIGNHLSGHNRGIENIVKFNPSKNFNIELSHSWFNYKSNYSNNQNYSSTSNGYPIIPQHILRLNMFKKFKHNIKIQTGITYTTEYCNRQIGYNKKDGYFDPFAEGIQNISNSNEPYVFNERFILNIKISKTFNDFFEVYFYGSDLKRDDSIESVNPNTTATPRNTGRILGIGFKLLKLPN